MQETIHEDQIKFHTFNHHENEQSFENEKFNPFNPSSISLTVITIQIIKHLTL